MGRKIPGKKHRGVKDPEKQRRERFNKIKNKVNSPPSNPDHQEVPHSINQISKFKEEFKYGTGKIQKRKHIRRLPFEQHKCESKRQFLHRVHKACDAVIQENAFENKYGVDIKRNPQTGKVEGLAKKPKDEIDILMKAMQKKKSKKGKKKSKDTKPALSKSQKRSKKLLEKKQKKLMLVTPEARTDKIKFGEVAHAPPILNAPRNVNKLGIAAQPGQKDLLLSSLMHEKKNSTSVDKVNKVANKVIDKTGKRKDLPNALRRKLDQEQTDIIKAYQLLKRQRYSTENT